MEKQRRAAWEPTGGSAEQPHHGLGAGSDPRSRLRRVDCLFFTTLEDIPALMSWVDSCQRDGWLRKVTAAEWRARIEARRRWLEREEGRGGAGEVPGAKEGGAEPPI